MPEELVFVTTGYGRTIREEFHPPVCNEAAVSTVAAAHQQASEALRIEKELAALYPDPSKPVCVFLKNIGAPMVLSRALALAALIRGNAELILPGQRQEGRAQKNG
jgi:hypothetical protein